MQLSFLLINALRGHLLEPLYHQSLCIIIQNHLALSSMGQTCCSHMVDVPGSMGDGPAPSAHTLYWVLDSIGHMGTGMVCIMGTLLVSMLGYFLLKTVCTSERVPQQ